MTFDFSTQVFFDLEVDAFWDPFLRGQVLLMCPPLPQKLHMVDELSLVDSLTKYFLKYFSFFEVLYPSPLLSKTHFWLARIISKAFCPQENFESEDNNHSFFLSSSSFTFSREIFEASTFEKFSFISSSYF